MIPILYQEGESFELTRIGPLTDCLTCHVVEERNGQYELEITYPINGRCGADIKVGTIIESATDDKSRFVGGKLIRNRFTVYKVTADISGILIVHAEQSIMHRMKKTTVQPITPGQYTAGQAIALIRQNLAGTTYEDLNFSFTYISAQTQTAHKFGFTEPRTLMETMMGKRGSILDVYGGEFDWRSDNLRVIAENSEHPRGRALGEIASVRYGVNLVDYTYEDDSAEQITGYLPYWKSQEEGGAEIVVIGSVIKHHTTVARPYEKIIPLDLSGDFQEQPSVQQLNVLAADKIATTTYTKSSTSVNLKFIPRESIGTSTGQYATIGLCDTIPIHIQQISLDTTAKITKTDFDVLTERYLSVEAGSPKKTLALALAQTAKMAGVSLYT